jgi:hypothetical protein
MRPSATRIGSVREVLGAQVTVAIDPRLAGVAPIWEGRLQPVGQVGALVRIPQGIIDLIASVALVGIRQGDDDAGLGIAVGERWMQVQLIGELDAGGKFQRGVSSYPALEDSVHFATASQLRAVGRPRPVLIVLEEAHRYLGESDSVGRARRAAERIAREGRKHGIGLTLVTQRPTELPDTALAQVGTLIALRLTNGADQQRVKAAMPESTAGMADALASLRTGEALVSGEAVVLPTRVVVDRPSPEPDAADATLDAWRGAAEKNDLAETISGWRAVLAEGS